MSDSQDKVRDEIAQLESENASLRAEIRSLRTFIDSMQNLMEAVEQPLPEAELMELLSDVLGNALHTINASDGSLLVLDEDTNELVFVITHGEAAKEQLAWQRLPPDEGIAGWVAKHRRATIVNDAQADDRFYPALDRELGFRTDSVLAAPIIGGGRVLGVIEVLNKKDDKLFTVGDQTLLTLMCRFAGELLFTVLQQSQGEK
ncbi:MAG: GAF domain-containing protein [Gammaproteobacteria bacterium]|nr:GAF domain-containing protein [Gammaproteobacteria bacterium]NIM73811.1 GAF domain-containing protein [Gammaproteobacteria bacterium]NIN39388.1 GAF domain-containing protein [Gammaproteobacteria bacterium]NIO25053.1 GAF domain-containing protein [Gammaproteobacteria bacterium]NIO65685.1 GAF domain-containing protein [Gammaproteobacteria bacterium]